MIRRKLTVSIAFTRRTAVYIIMFGRSVVTKMTGNANYTTPDPTLVAIIAALDAGDAAIEAAMNHGKQEIIDRNAAVAIVVELLTQLATYVQLNCKNDLSILTSSGFEATKNPSPIGPLATTLPPKMTQGKVSGSCRARVKRVNGAYTYIWRIALASAPNVYVQTIQTTGAHVDFAGLTPGEVYNTDVQAVGSAGMSSVSNVGCIRVI